MGVFGKGRESMLVWWALWKAIVWESVGGISS